MTSADHLVPTAGFASIETLKSGSRSDARAIADYLAHEVHACTRTTEGFVSAQICLSLDGTTVVRRNHWVNEKYYRTFLASKREREDLADFPGVRSIAMFEGIPQIGLEGPALGSPPGIIVIATRRVSGHESSHAVLALLHKSGDWKRQFPGFISATPYISNDGKMFVNCPMWVDRQAFDAWTADPKIADARQEVVEQEAAPPEIVLCGLDEYIEAIDGRYSIRAPR